ncbi:MAG: glycoside hydrolase family 15 protein [Actinomycetaceae bacterium]|nr:glycoside hydrolase family 15 protein [Actinomycetaceae bacterium]
MTTQASLGHLLKHSRTVITSLQEPNGAYPASPSFSAYKGYCWFRDGSFIADGVSAAGEVESASRFFDWCAMVIMRYQDRIGHIIEAAHAGNPLPDEQMLPTRFTFDGSMGQDDWWDFQLDGYGTWLWALGQHALRHKLNIDVWKPAAQLTVDYLLSSWDRPCFDWWEEHREQQHISTLGCIAAGLQAAIEAGLVEGLQAQAAVLTYGDIKQKIIQEGTADFHLCKWIGNDSLDGSLSALIAPLRVIDPACDLAKGTIAALEQQLSVDFGVHRFLGDTFYGGGRWPLLSCFLGLAHVSTGNAQKARQYLDWAASTATESLELPEQVGNPLLAPERRQEWRDRWGEVATPLLWSHAMLLRLAVELGINVKETSS